MSLNSLQDNMSRRAASMAAMAKRASDPQEIQAIQKSLITGVQDGSIQPYIGIPLIQDLTKKLTEAKAQMAQNVAGAGMPQTPQAVPVAQQVMQQAAQESQGVEALPSNLPQEYAGGGIIAFENGGEVERFQVGGQPKYETPYDRMNRLNREAAEAERVGREAQMRERPGEVMFKDPLSGPDYAANTEAGKNPFKQDIRVGQPYTPNMAGMLFGYNTLPSDAQSAATPAAAGAYSNEGRSFTPKTLPTATPAAAPGGAGGIGGGGGYKMPTLASMKETPAPTLTDYDTIIGNLPKEQRDASEAKVKEAEAKLAGFDAPGEASRESRFSKREAEQEKNAATTRAMGLINLGFGIAGSKERTLAGALGNEGRQGIQSLIQGEAANRAAKDRLEDARDNFEQQKVAAKKGNYQAAEAAGNRASDDVRAATQLTMAGAHYGNTEALNRYQTQQQGEFQKTSLNNQGVLGLADIAVKEKHIAQQAAAAKAQLASQEKRFAALDKTSQARLDQVRVNAFNGFNKDVAPTINAQLIKQYGPNWQTSQDPRSLQAQMIFKQYRDAHVMDALGKHDERMSYGRSADELLQSGQ